ncbi:MAG: GDSL-type esterase/lipase family protein [Ruminococcus sp.]|nr:GDSL-type esterase/lipase family protein [Ruminococcus sp.]
MKRFLALALSLTAITFSMPVKTGVSAEKLVSYKFDFGGLGTENGYIGVSASDGYSSSKGYGFAKTDAVENVKANGTGALADAVRFKSDVPNHIFNADLPKGVYKITVTTGNDQSTTISAEGRSQLYFLTGNNATDSFTIPVTDGQLNIYATNGVGESHSFSTLEIEQISADTVTKPTIWLYGDSTVCNYYNVPDTNAHGWGQALSKYIDTDKYDVRNMAINGMSAAKLAAHDSFEVSEYYGKSGDILLISIGINDYRENEKNNKDSSEYEAAMTDMVRRAKAKGMTVYLVKQQGMLYDHIKYPVITNQWYGDKVEKIAESENVGIIDLFQPWLEFCLEKTYYCVPDYYQSYEDGSVNEIHPNKKGADILAEMAAEQLFPSPLPPDDTDTGLSEGFDNAQTVVYKTEVSEGPIANPHKGFVMEITDPAQFEPSYRYGIGGEYNNHAWDVVKVCYDVLFWKDLNPSEGVYKWDDIDEMLEACEKHGMTYGIRVLPYSTGAGSDDNYGATHNFVPQWVFDKGAKMDVATYKYGDPSVKIKIPDWSDPVYIQAYKDFITAMAERYDGDPRVEFVEIRAFGNFGEWHTSQFIGNEMPSIELQKDMLDHFAAVFDTTTLCALSDVKGEIYDYALSIGITKRNDGLIMTPNEEWDLRPVYRANYPVMGDYHNEYNYMKNIAPDNSENYLPWTETRFRETIEIPHLTMLSIDMDSTFGYQIYRENKELLDEMSHRLGYNFTVTSAKRNGKKLLVTIKNTGLAPAFFNIDLCAEITDKDGNKLRSFGKPVRIEKGTFRDDEEKAFLFEYDGNLDEKSIICLAMYDADNSLAEGKDPTVKFDNKNTLSSNRFMLSADVPDGDVNADGEFNIADAVTMQKWLLASTEVTVKNWKAGDLCEDNVLDVSDLCIMKRMLIYEKAAKQ